MCFNNCERVPTYIDKVFRAIYNVTELSPNVTLIVTTVILDRLHVHMMMNPQDLRVSILHRYTDDVMTVPQTINIPT